MALGVMLSRCSGCQGQKRVMGIGSLERDCAVCKGIGWLKLDEALSLVDEAVVPTNNVVVKIDKRSKEYRDSRI